MNLHETQKKKIFNIVIYLSYYSSSLVVYSYFQEREHQNYVNLKLNRNISLFYVKQ